MDFRGEDELPESKMAGISENDFRQLGIGCAERGKRDVECLCDAKRSHLSAVPVRFLGGFCLFVFYPRQRFLVFSKGRR